jgi:hypothetical protein
VLKLARQPYYRWLDQPVTDAMLEFCIDGGVAQAVVLCVWVSACAWWAIAHAARTKAATAGERASMREQARISWLAFLLAHKQNRAYQRHWYGRCRADCAVYGLPATWDAVRTRSGLSLSS